MGGVERSAFLNPQAYRVMTINHRLRIADVLIKPETAHMAETLVRGIRRDIIRDKPHHKRPDCPLLQQALSAYMEPLETAKGWRHDINTRLAVIKAIGEKMEKTDAK